MNHDSTTCPYRMAADARRAFGEFGEALNNLLESSVAQLSPTQLAEYKRRLDKGELPFDALAKIK